MMKKLQSLSNKVFKSIDYDACSRPLFAELTHTTYRVHPGKEYFSNNSKVCSSPMDYS